MPYHRFTAGDVVAITPGSSPPTLSQMDTGAVLDGVVLQRYGLCFPIGTVRSLGLQTLTQSSVGDDLIGISPSCTTKKEAGICLRVVSMPARARTDESLPTPSTWNTF